MTLALGTSLPVLAQMQPANPAIDTQSTTVGRTGASPGTSVPVTTGASHSTSKHSTDCVETMGTKTAQAPTGSNRAFDSQSEVAGKAVSKPGAAMNDAKSAAAKAKCADAAAMKTAHPDKMAPSHKAGMKAAAPTSAQVKNPAFDTPSQVVGQKVPSGITPPATMSNGSKAMTKAQRDQAFDTQSEVGGRGVPGDTTTGASGRMKQAPTATAPISDNRAFDTQSEVAGKRVGAGAVGSAMISQSDARKKALSAVPGGTIESGNVGDQQGKQTWSFQVREPNSTTVREVHVDAATGRVKTGQM
ncbi:MAG: PepSY domain-containing protein [Casimicrobiaceae bacterium]